MSTKVALQSLVYNILDVKSSNLGKPKSHKNFTSRLMDVKCFKERNNGRCIKVGASIWSIPTSRNVARCLWEPLSRLSRQAPVRMDFAEKSAAPRERRRAGAALTLCRTGGSVKDVVCCSLRLCGGMNEKLAISAEFLEPACEIGGLIANDPV